MCQIALKKKQNTLPCPGDNDPAHWINRESVTMLNLPLKAGDPPCLHLPSPGPTVCLSLQPGRKGMRSKTLHPEIHLPAWVCAGAIPRAVANYREKWCLSRFICSIIMLWLEIYFEFHVSLLRKNLNPIYVNCGRMPPRMHNLDVSIFNLKFLDKQKGFECAIILCLNKSLLKYGLEEAISSQAIWKVVITETEKRIFNFYISLSQEDIMRNTWVPASCPYFRSEGGWGRPEPRHSGDLEQEHRKRHPHCVSEHLS